MEDVWKATQEYQAMADAFQPTFDAIKNFMNLTKNINFYDAYAIMDVFQDDIYDNKPIPKDIPPELWKNLTFAYQMDMYVELYGSTKQRQLVSTPFYQELIAIFNQHISGNSTYKWHMYSAHDTTIGQLLTALNLTTYNCIYEIFTTGKSTANACIYEYPNFATSLIVELYKDDIGRYVKVLYNGEYQPLCNQQSTECDYNEFVMRIQNAMLSEPEFQSLCQTGKYLSEIQMEQQNTDQKIKVKQQEINEEQNQIKKQQKKQKDTNQMKNKIEFYAQPKEEVQEEDNSWIFGKIAFIFLQFISITFLAMKLKSFFLKKKNEQSNNSMDTILIQNAH